MQGEGTQDGRSVFSGLCEFGFLYRWFPALSPRARDRWGLSFWLLYFLVLSPRSDGLAPGLLMTAISLSRLQSGHYGISKHPARPLCGFANTIGLEAVSTVTLFELLVKSVTGRDAPARVRLRAASEKWIRDLCRPAHSADIGHDAALARSTL